MVRKPLLLGERVRAVFSAKGLGAAAGGRLKGERTMGLDFFEGGGLLENGNGRSSRGKLSRVR